MWIMINSTAEKPSVCSGYFHGFRRSVYLIIVLDADICSHIEVCGGSCAIAIAVALHMGA